MEFKDKTVLAFCGIANPDRFFSLLQRIGAKVVLSLAFADHYPYPEKSIKRIKEIFEELRPDAAVTTEKDAVKLTGPGGLAAQQPLYYLKIGLELDQEFYELFNF